MPGEPKMTGFFTRSDKTMWSNIARHSRLRSERVALERHHEQARLVLRYPVLVYYRWREKSAFARLISSKPANARDAREKLVYLMALMTSNVAALHVSEVQCAVRTLHPFRSDLAEALGCSTSRRW
jgi:hypothetical protein